MLLPEIVNFFDKVYLLLAFSLVLLLFFYLYRGKSKFDFTLCLCSLLLLDVLAVAKAYSIVGNNLAPNFSLEYGITLGFTAAFSLLNLMVLNFLFNTSYGLYFSKKKEKTPLIVDLSACWKESLPLFSLFVILLTLVSLTIFLEICMVDILSYLINKVDVEIAILVCFVLLLNTFFLIVWGLNAIKKSLELQILEKKVSSFFSLSSSQKCLLAFFKANKKALKDPLALFFGLSAFLRDSDLFFWFMFVFFYRLNGGIYFCLAATIFLLIFVLSTLSFVRTRLISKYGSNVIHQLGWNPEATAGKTFVIKGGPRAIAILIAGTVVREVIITGRQLAEQHVNNSVASSANDNLIAERAKVGQTVSKDELVEAKIAPRRTFLTQEPMSYPEDRQKKK